MYPKIFSDLINHLKKLPGIGEKTAERLALFILNNFNENELNDFSNTILNLKNIKKCKICNIMSCDDICSNCKNIVSDTLIIVENSIDAFQIMKTNEFKNLFHILGNLIDYSNGYDEESINFESILKRLDNINEVIIALNSTLQGELTSKYLINRINEFRKDIKITKLANGLPFGSELKYISNETLKRALENRIIIQK